MNIGQGNYPVQDSPLNLLDSLNKAIQARQRMAQAKTTEAELPYAAESKRAQALSREAYSGLMGPQFMAKLMSNPEILANMPDEQKRQVLSMITNAGTGGRLSAGINQQLGMQSQAQQPMQSRTNLTSNIEEFLDGKLPQPIDINQDQMQTAADFPPDQIMGGQPSTIPTWAQTTGEHKGQVALGEAYGKKIGEKNAEKLNELSETVFSGVSKQQTLDDLSEILSSPSFEDIKQHPLLGAKELSYYQRFGTPDQQRLVGKFKTLTGNLVKDSSRDFAGQFRSGEQQLLMSMKPTDSDTFDAARGKTEELSVLNKMLTDRSRLAARLMQDKRMNYLDAQETADKMIDGKKIRDQIKNRLYGNERENKEAKGNVINHGGKKYQNVNGQWMEV